MRRSHARTQKKKKKKKKKRRKKKKKKKKNKVTVFYALSTGHHGYIRAKNKTLL